MEVNNLAQGTINTPRETTIQRIATALENILNKIVDTSSAGNIDYDNTESELSADKVQGAIDELAEEKVDKVTGKGLSTNDYTDTEKQKNADNASDIEDIQEDISQPLTATGNPLTIQASESNLVECTAEVEAVQEGSGDPSPTNIRPITGQTEVVIEDCGKNLWDINNFGGKQDSSTTYSFDGNTLTITGKWYVWFYADVKPNTNYVFSRIIDSFTVARGLSFFGLNSDGTINQSDLITNSSEIFNSGDRKKIAILLYSGNNTSGTTTMHNIQLEEGTQSTTYEPYTGKTYRVEIGQKNKLPMTVDGIKSANTSGTWSGNSYTISGVTFEIQTDKNGNVTGIDANGTSTGNIELKLTGTTQLENGEYIYNIPELINISNIWVSISSPRVAIAVASATNVNVSVTGGFIDTAYIYISSGNTLNHVLFQPMLRLATETDSTFVPYNPNLPDTIYGGELDVLTGKLRVTHGEVDLGDLTWEYSGTSGQEYFYCSGFNAKPKSSSEDLINAISDSYIQTGYNAVNGNNGTFGTGASGTYLKVCDTRYTDATAFKTAVTGQTLVYELATPFTIQLTPQQIRLLKGTNNISCNTGDLSIKYYPDNVLGQLKGDIESEYDERVETLETQMLRRPELKSLTITNKLTSNDGVAVINELSNAIIVGAYLYNADDNDNTVVAIPYLAVSGRLPFLKICRDSTTLSLLAGVHISGIIYYFEI